MDALGIFSFAASGAFAAMEKRFDTFGVLIIAFITAIGGGTMRDIILGDLPVAWLSNSITTIVIFVATVCALLFSSYLKKLDKMLFLFDAIGLGLFTLVGIERGLAHDLNIFVCIMLGTITGCFGGVLRDIVLNQVPLIFHREIYALASIFGGITFFLLLYLDINGNIAYLVAVSLVILIRILAVRYDLALPKLYKNHP